jgi:hypothetical protein
LHVSNFEEGLMMAVPKLIGRGSVMLQEKWLFSRTNKYDVTSPTHQFFSMQ